MEIKSIFEKNHRWVPILLLFLCLGTYGVYLPRLGFYWDDWMHLYYVNKYDVAPDVLYYTYRPLFAWLDVISISFLGLKPLYWHLFALGFYWLTAWSFWEVLKRIWPKQKERMVWAVMLFSVYPVFFKQSVAVVFRGHFFSFACFLLSVVFMIQAYRKRDVYWKYTILGMVTTLGHLFTIEYFTGLEIVRLVIIWLIISPQQDVWWDRLKITLKNWLPYLLMIVIFILWRFVFFQGQSDHLSISIRLRLGFS